MASTGRTRWESPGVSTTQADAPELLFFFFFNGKMSLSKPSYRNRWQAAVAARASLGAVSSPSRESPRAPSLAHAAKVSSSSMCMGYI